jgi:hypothetical protein
MKQFFVKMGTLCRLVDVISGTEQPYSTSHDNTFTRDDVVFDPVAWLVDHKEVISEYGFRSGDVRQRARYVLVVPSTHVEVHK